MVRAGKTSKSNVTEGSSPPQDTSSADASPTSNLNFPTPSSPQSRNKASAANKKRKRVSETMEGSISASKDLRDKKRKVKEEDGECANADQDESASELGEDDALDSTSPSLAPYDARRVLEVLEVVDPSGLLDVESTSRGMTSTLRKLLEEPSSVSLRALLDRIRHEAPVRDSRTRPVRPAVVKFFRLAQMLLQDIAQRSSAVKFLDDAVISPKDDEPDEDTKTTATKSENKTEESLQYREKHIQYALHQHLPTGDFFTSATVLTKKEITLLAKGQASLTAVLPTVPVLPPSLPKLGDYAPGVANHPRRPYSLRKAPVPISSASFLDYGPFASLAPAFDSDGGQIGRDTLGLVLEMKGARKARRLGAVRRQVELANLKEKPLPSIEPFPHVQELSALGLEDRSTRKLVYECKSAKAELRGLAREMLPEDVVEDFLISVDQMELERGVGELLIRISNALGDLQVLQERRLRAGAPGKEVPVEIDGEEWHLARQILSSLTTIASLRPRASTSSLHSIIPPPNVLHTIHKTLPREPVPGYKGTLLINRDYALIDNTTIRSSALPVPPPITGSTSNPTQTLPPTPAMMQGGFPAAGANRAPTQLAYSYHRPAAANANAQTPHAQGGTTMQYYRQGYYSPHYSQSGYYGYAGYATTTGAVSATPHYTPPPNATAGGRALPNLATKSLSGWGYASSSPAPSGGASGGATAVGTGGVLPSATALPVHMRRINGTATPGSQTPGTPGSPATGSYVWNSNISMPTTPSSQQGVGTT
ncbi:uncharacterized protein EI90DRAFT_3019004 [Cantharellus anzutake]|uniref:uncharacterized protein n=1 Tax=Cantharellus anzutake TaxID=1750568 RepID=UPI001903978E|nr:uncharacterized protein EI90DRAFT_3019004 [Cantharellus anzutake]KAF8325542.1 hypothetical protein EI90DRAFT_3019004 [Cantharellus anzutake]